MCDCDLIHTKSVIAGSTVLLMARIEAEPGVMITPDQADSARIDLYELGSDNSRTPVDNSGDKITDGTAYDDDPVSPYAGTSGGVVHDGETAGWEKDSVGFNSSYKMATPSGLSHIGKVYEARLTVTDTNNNNYVAVWKLPSR